MKFESLDEKLRAKIEHCRALISRAGRLAIGFSGGVDSALLLAVAIDVLGVQNVLAVTATGFFHPDSETNDARELARMLGANIEEISFENIDDERVLSNPPDRCYWCKRKIFSMIAELAQAQGFDAVASGANFDDLSDYRPGTRAENELGILKPLQQAKLTKADIRELSRALDLPTASKPSKACLASRVPYGTRLTAEKLARIDQAEQGLTRLGFPQCRVRDHENLARVEVPKNQLAGALEQRDKIVKILQQAGYQYATLDLQGFRTGSMNETLDL